MRAATRATVLCRKLSASGELEQRRQAAARYEIDTAAAAAITAVLTVLLCRGIRESARVSHVRVVFKLALISLFVVVGAAYVQPAHWRPVAPGGWRGIWTGASMAFFS